MEIIRKALENAFDPSELQEAIEDIIGEYIDYDEIARDILNSRQDLIHDVALTLANDLISDLPF